MNDELVGAIISLGRGLSLPVTAEGVESDAILERLRRMGDLKGQGYLYGQPEDGATTRERLRALDADLGQHGAAQAFLEAPLGSQLPAIFHGQGFYVFVG